jgi:23S rRNA (guanine745-N1)-methyltransferase
MNIGSNEDILRLFSMTPYYYRTDPEQSARLGSIDKLDITADFELLVYKTTANNDK